MKLLLVISTMSMILVINTINGEDTKKDRLFGYYQKIDSAMTNKQVDKLVFLLIDLESCSEQRFGNGYGPFDRTSLQITIIDTLYWLSNEVYLNLNDSDKIRGAEKGNEWFEFLKTPANSFEIILKMLKHKNPAVRYYGLMKLKDKPPIEIIEELKRTTNNDDYIVLTGVKKKIASTNNLPDNGIVGGIRESTFSARLRNIASQKLNSWNIASSIDEKKVAHDGIIMLVKMYQDGNRLLKEEILESIYLFPIDGLATEALRNFDCSNISDQEKSIIELFCKQLIQKQSNEAIPKSQLYSS